MAEYKMYHRRRRVELPGTTDEAGKKAIEANASYKWNGGCVIRFTEVKGGAKAPNPTPPLAAKKAEKEG